MLPRLGLAVRRSPVGRLALRRGLPRPAGGAARDAELALYRGIATLLLCGRQRREVARVVDVGCRNWSYAAALADAFPRADLVGVEVDGNRRFVDLFRRIDHARAHAADLDRPAQVVHGDFRTAPLPPGPQAGVLLFVFFYPFLSAAPARAWGLPAEFADFAALLARARAHAAGRPCLWLSAHQGAWEAEEAAEIYGAAGAKMQAERLSAARCPAVATSPYDPWVFAGRPHDA